MRTTVEFPDELLARVRSRAALSGISLRQFFIEAVEQKLSVPGKKARRPLPAIGSSDAPIISVLTPEQLDEAMFG